MTKPNFVFLSGLLCDDALWSHQIKHLDGKVNITIPNLTRHESVAELATHALAGTSENFTLVGLSMGGYVALEMMRRAPEKINQLILIDTSARPDTPEQVRRRRGLIDLARRGNFKGVTPRLLPLLIAEKRLQDESLTHVIMEMATRVGKDAFLKQQTAILGRLDSRPFLGAINIPTTIICGSEDALTPPEHSEEMAGLIGQNAQLYIIEGAGHLAPLEAPSQVNAILEKIV